MSKKKQNSKKNRAKSDDFAQAKRLASEYLNSRDQVYRLAREAIHKAGNHQTALAKVWIHLLNLIEMLRSWSKGKYQEIPSRTLLFSIAALIYFINPLDAIPDPLPFAGYIDDSLIIGLVVAAIQSDLNRFIEWKNQQKKKAADLGEADNSELYQEDSRD